MSKFLPEFLSKEKVNQIVIANRQVEVKIPDQLLKAHDLWYGKKEGMLITRADQIKDIEATLDEVAAYLRTLGVAEDKLKAFVKIDELDGLLRNQIKVREQTGVGSSVLFMREIIDYAALLSTVSAEKRNNALEEFPAGMSPAEFNCIGGGRERLQLAVRKMQIGKLKPQDKVVMIAHDIVAEKARQRFSPKLIFRNFYESHLVSGIDHLFDMPDTTQNAAKDTVAMVPMDIAWKEFVAYIPAMNRELHEISQAADLRKLIAKYPQPHEKWEKVGVELGMMEIAPESVVLMEEKKDKETQEVSYISHWKKEEIDEAFPLVQVSASHDLPLPRSLFDEDAPEKIVNLIESEKPANRQIGLKALSMLGDHHQLGRSPVQFFNCLQELGNRTENAGNNALTIAMEKLRQFKIPENENVNSTIDEVLRWEEYYRGQKAARNNDGIESYIAFLEGNSDQPQIGDLFRGNAPAGMLISHLNTTTFPEVNVSKNWDKLIHNPGCQDVITTVIGTQNGTFVQLGADLAFKAAMFRDMELLKFIGRGFDSPYYVGKDMLRTGLLKTKEIPLNASSYFTKSGLDFLFDYDPSLLREVIGEEAGKVNSTIFSEWKRKTPILPYLARNNRFSDLKMICELCTNTQAVTLLHQSDSLTRNTLEAAAEVGNEQIVNYLTSESLMSPNGLDIWYHASPLRIAVQYDRVGAARALLKNGASLTHKKNKNLLSSVVCLNNDEMFQLFKEQKDEKGNPFFSAERILEYAPTSFDEAVKAGNEEAAKFLLAAKTEDGKPIFNPSSGMKEAVKNERPNIVKLLIKDYGVRVTGAHLIESVYCSPEMFELLFENRNANGAEFNVNYVDENNLSFMKHALKEERADCIAPLVAAGINPLDKDGNGITYLHQAILANKNRRDGAMLKAMIPEDNLSKDRLDIDTPRDGGQTPIEMAVNVNNLEAVKILLKAGSKGISHILRVTASSEIKEEIDKYRVLKNVAKSVVASANRKCEIVRDSPEIIVSETDPTSRLEELEFAIYHQLIRNYSDNVGEFFRDNGKENVKSGVVIDLMSDKLAKKMKRHLENTNFFEKTKAFEFDLDEIYTLFPERDSCRPQQPRPQSASSLGINLQKVAPEKNQISTR